MANISKITGYDHQRTLGRMSMDSSMRNTNKTEVAMGMFGLLSLLLPIVVVGMIFFS